MTSGVRVDCLGACLKNGEYPSGASTLETVSHDWALSADAFRGRNVLEFLAEERGGQRAVAACASSLGSPRLLAGGLVVWDRRKHDVSLGSGLYANSQLGVRTK